MVCLSAFCTAWFDFLFLGDFYLPHPPDSTQQGISFSTLGPLTTNSIPMPCCSPPCLASPIVFAQMFRHRSRAPSCIQFFPLPLRTLPPRCNWTPPHHRRVGWSRREHCYQEYFSDRFSHFVSVAADLCSTGPAIPTFYVRTLKVIFCQAAL